MKRFNFMTISKKISLEMKSEGHYKKAAANYKRSPQYINMLSLYPILLTSIEDCKNENLVN